MSVWTLLFGFLPIVVYVIVDWRKGVKWGAVAALAMSVIELLSTKIATGVWDQLSIINCSLFLTLGAVTIATNRAHFIKFQPVILGLFFASFLAYFQYFDTPFLLKFANSESLLVAPEFKKSLEDPLVRYKMVALNEGLIYVLVTHAILTAYAALRMSSFWWLAVRTVGLYLLMSAMAFGLHAYWSAFPIEQSGETDWPISNQTKS